MAHNNDPIPLYQPDLGEQERKNVIECLDSTWISSKGHFVDQFESAFASYHGMPQAVSVCNGTVALHVALHCLGIGRGDEVIVPTFTYIASVNAIALTGATPVFADCRAPDWLIDPEDVARKLTPRTRAVMPVHLYGAVCDMYALAALAETHAIAIVEDCAEALGARLDGKLAGTFGEVSTFSFFGNKLITTGEGGMLLARETRLADRIRHVKGQAQSARAYWHDELGFNYRMTNICAAIGVAQMQKIDAYLERKRSIADLYKSLLSGQPVAFQKSVASVLSSNWLVSLLLPAKFDRDEIIALLAREGIETRPVFYCAHEMPMYRCALAFPEAERISRHGISVPSYPTIRDDQIERVASTLSRLLERGAARC